MKKVLVNYGGLVMFYLIIVFGVLFLCPSTKVTTRPSSFNASITASK